MENKKSTTLCDSKQVRVDNRNNKNTPTLLHGAPTPLRLRHNEETAYLLGYPSKDALRMARIRGNLPTNSYHKEGRFWYYIVHKIIGHQELVELHEVEEHLSADKDARVKSHSTQKVSSQKTRNKTKKKVDKGRSIQNSIQKVGKVKRKEIRDRVAKELNLL